MRARPNRVRESRGVCAGFICDYVDQNRRPLALGITSRVRTAVPLLGLAIETVGGPGVGAGAAGSSAAGPTGPGSSLHGPLRDRAERVEAVRGSVAHAIWVTERTQRAARKRLSSGLLRAHDAFQRRGVTSQAAGLTESTKRRGTSAQTPTTARAHTLPEVRPEGPQTCPKVTLWQST